MAKQMAAERAERHRLSTISNALVRLHARHYGKGPAHARTYLYDDFVLVLLYEPFTPAEMTFVEHGASEHVIDNRLRFYRLVEGEFRRSVSEITGRDVVAFLPQLSLDPPVVCALFLLRAKGSPG